MIMETNIKYDHLIIYYFSGTGNAKNTSIWIETIAKENGLTTLLINLDHKKYIETPTVIGKTLIGFCAPTHGFNLPPIVLNAIWKFPKLKNTDVFIINTRGGLKLSKLFLPGLSGLAQILPALILLAKRFRIVGMQPIDLPSNWIFLHPGLKPKVIDSIYQRCHPIINNFTLDILEGKRKYKALLSLPIDILTTPIAILYLFIGRFFLAKTLVATDNCNSCGKCVKQCPVGAITMLDHIPFWSYECESCMRCVNICPERAIETTQGYNFVFFVLAFTIIPPSLFYLMSTIGFSNWISSSVLTENLWELITMPIYLALAIISYKILHFGMRFHFINRMIRYTSLSSNKFWRRYHPPKY